MCNSDPAQVRVSRCRGSCSAAWQTPPKSVHPRKNGLATAKAEVGARRAVAGAGSLEHVVAEAVALPITHHDAAVRCDLAGANACAGALERSAAAALRLAAAQSGCVACELCLALVVRRLTVGANERRPTQEQLVIGVEARGWDARILAKLEAATVGETVGVGVAIRFTAFGWRLSARPRIPANSAANPTKSAGSGTSALPRTSTLTGTRSLSCGSLRLSVILDKDHLAATSER